MNRKNLTAAVLAGLAGAAGIVGSAQAVNLNPDGLGQVLIYPYYTTNGGNFTILSVVNTTDEAKAVKVRFLEGQNSQEVLDFNLYMSAWDVWAAAVFDDDGVPTLAINDSSCTVPYLYGSGGIQEFLPYEMAKDGGSSDISRAAEGHFEMIEMGTLVDDNGFETAQGSASAATHGTGFNCDQLVAAWTDPDNTVQGDEGYWLNQAQDLGPLTDIETPSGGLFGGAAIVHVAGGAMYSYDAKAVNGFADSVVGPQGPLHQAPGDADPSLNSGNITDSYVFLPNGEVFEGTSTRGVDAVSMVFMHDQVMNEYTTEAAVAANTEWVLTFPTKSFYVYEEDSGSPLPIAPFTSVWDGELPGACEVVVLDTIWDREEARPGIVPGEPVPPIVSPAPPDPKIPGVVPFSLCFETSVLRFGDPEGVGETEILGSKNFHSIDNEALGFEYGWARLQMNEHPQLLPNGDIDFEAPVLPRELDELMGLPVTGFAVQRFVNGFLGDGADVLANYGGIYQHKGTRLQSGDYWESQP